MKLLLIRHGESEADLLDVHEGRADFALTERGHRQAQAMAEYVSANYHVDRIYASTLTRAMQTARQLSDATGVPIRQEPDLMEFNNGLLAGLSHRGQGESNPNRFFRADFLQSCLICLDNTTVLSAAASLS